MNDPSQSGPTYPFIAGMMNYLGGVSQGEAFFTKLKANGLVIHPTNGPTLQALTSGQIKLALVQSSAGIGATFGRQRPKLAVKYLNPVTVLPCAIGIDAKAPTAEQRGGREVHRVRALASRARRSCRPATPTATRCTTRCCRASIRFRSCRRWPSVKTQTINPYKWGPLESTINTWFVSTIVK